MNYTIQPCPLKWKRSLHEALNPNNVEGIALHHMVHPNASIQTIHGWHMDRWQNEPGFGYNFFVTLTGVIIEGRGYTRGAHVSGHNSKLVGIGFQGNYHRDRNVPHREIMPDEQFNAGIWLIKEIQKRMPNAKTVDGHKRWQATACPGEFFPLDEFKRGQYRGQDNTTTYTVKAGDTFWGIAQASDGAFTVADLERWNPGVDPRRLQVGQRINVGESKPSVQYTRPLRWVVGQPTMTGEDVKAVQKVVGVKVDGRYGPLTAAAVRAYQQRHGLIVDGIAGPQTFTHMFG